MQAFVTVTTGASLSAFVIVQSVPSGVPSARPSTTLDEVPGDADEVTLASITFARPVVVTVKE